MNPGNRNHKFDFRKKFVLNYSRDSERDLYPKDFLHKPFRPNMNSISFSQKSEHRTTSPGSILNFKFGNNFKETPPLHSRSSFIGKRDTNQFIHKSIPNYNLPFEKIEPPKFSFKDPYFDRKDRLPSIGSFTGFNPQNVRSTIVKLEPIAKLSFADQLNKKFMLPVKKPKNIIFPKNCFINESVKKEKMNQCYFTSRENSLSYQEPQLPQIPLRNFREESQRSRECINSRYNENLLSSMKPRLFPATLGFQTKISALNFSNPNSRRCDKFKPVSKLNLSFNEKNRPLEVIKCSEVASKASHISFGSFPTLEQKPTKPVEMIKISANLSKNINKVEPSPPQKNGKLQIMVSDFEKDLEEDLDISEDDRKALLLLLKFLYDFDISHKCFSELSDEYQTSFNKFMIDRYFKDEIERDNQIKFLYHDILVTLDDKKNLNAQKKDILFKGKISESIKRNINVKDEVKFINVHVKKYRKGILDSIHPEYLKGFVKNLETNELKCKTVQMTSRFLLEESPKILLLQDYLRKRERLNLICRRRKKMHRKSKRNDEKIKKIFKRIMKSLLKKYRTKYLNKSYSVLSSMERERAFYTHYFGNLDGEIPEFYDPLKRKLANPKFKSISTKYLTFLAQSELFVKDLREYCSSEMVIEVLEKYPEQLLKRFKENPRFLVEMDKFKTKFEWIKHELQAAIYHFMSIFNICQIQATRN